VVGERLFRPRVGAPRLESASLGREVERPLWFDEPALSPFAVTSAQDERAFARYNHGRPYRDQIRPWSFGMLAHVHPLARTTEGPTVLMAPGRVRDTDPLPEEWIDRGHPSRPPIAIRFGDPMWVIEDAVNVQTYADYFEMFARHAESKAAGSDGEPCTPWTRGPLGMRAIAVTSLVRIGKEAGRLVEDPASGESSSFRVQEYRPSACSGCGKPISPDRRWCSEACRKGTERRLTAIARTCSDCGKSLAPGQRRWCSETCRKRAERSGAMGLDLRG
jgi:predicted nucleic acid-binding Zn ribbon protein